jgi:hypothetical protein
MDETPPAARQGAPPWPALSAADLRRLHFFAYLRRTGRLRPAAPVTVAVDALCTALLQEPPAPRVKVSGPYHGGLPPLWQTWAEKQKQRGAHAR